MTDEMEEKQETPGTGWLLVAFGGAALLAHALTNGRYGYFRDELYYLACGQHLAPGYVDQPPLSIWLLRLSQIALGHSLPAIRLLPAIAGAGIVALTGALAREMGGRAWAIALACVSALSAMFLLAVGNFFSLNAFEHCSGQAASTCWSGSSTAVRPNFGFGLGYSPVSVWKINIPWLFSVWEFL